MYYKAIIDEYTCDVCRKRDGKIATPGQAHEAACRNETEEGNEIGCRCKLETRAGIISVPEGLIISVLTGRVIVCGIETCEGKEIIKPVFDSAFYTFDRQELSIRVSSPDLPPSVPGQMLPRLNCTITDRRPIIVKCSKGVSAEELDAAQKALHRFNRGKDLLIPNDYTVQEIGAPQTMRGRIDGALALLDECEECFPAAADVETTRETAFILSSAIEGVRLLKRIMGIAAEQKGGPDADKKTDFGGECVNGKKKKRKATPMPRSKQAARYLAANPFCERCARRKIRYPAHEVHHLVKRSQGGRDVPSNFYSVCRDCHTQIERSRTEHYAAIGHKTYEAFKKKVTRKQGGGNETR